MDANKIAVSLFCAGLVLAVLWSALCCYIVIHFLHKFW